MVLSPAMEGLRIDQSRPIGRHMSPDFDEVAKGKTYQRRKSRDMCRSWPMLGSRTVNIPVLIAPTVTVAFKAEIRTTARPVDKFVVSVFSDGGSLLARDNALVERIFSVCLSTIPNTVARQRSTRQQEDI